MFTPVRTIDTAWSCLRDPNSNLVYFVHSKCACTFYKSLFNKLKWIHSTTLDINWSTDIVFSYIRQPIEKQRVGIVEWFFYNNQTKILDINKDNTEFLQLLSEIVYIDWHSMSIYDHLGEQSQKITWFPIDQQDFNHKSATLDFIEKHSGPINIDIKKWFLSSAPLNVSNGLKKEYKNKLLKIPPTSLITKYIDYDVCLYDYVVTQLLGNYPE